ncbi:MAG: hypothetical protein FGM22_07400 [Burkholderiaceae bacterium]|nr:hypothetical protein [Burkholderiaceae bacterium]
MNPIGIGIGATAGYVVGRYALYPYWQNGQTDPAKAIDPTKQAIVTVGAALIGAAAGYYLTRPRATERPRSKRESNEHYYGYGSGHMADNDAPRVVGIYEETWCADVYMLVFLDETLKRHLDHYKVATIWSKQNKSGLISIGYYKEKEIRHLLKETLADEKTRTIMKNDKTYDVLLKYFALEKVPKNKVKAKAKGYQIVTSLPNTSWHSVFGKKLIGKVLQSKNFMRDNVADQNEY